MIAIEGKPPKIVAEISCNHKGSLELAKELITQAKWARADYVKIQAYRPEDLTIDQGYRIGEADGTPWDNMNLAELYTGAYTPDWMIEPMFRHAHMLGIPIFASVFSVRSLKVLEDLGCPMYKIASFENNDYELIREISKTHKPMVISLGVASPGTVSNILDILAQPYDVTFMHCNSAYPAHPNEADIFKLSEIAYQIRKANGSAKIGFSDHTITSHAAMAATVLGASMIEKHMVKAGDYDTYDEKHSIDQYQFAKYVEDIHTIHSTIHANYNPEGPYKQFKRSLYVVKDIGSGYKITHDNVKAMRPYTGMDPIMLDDVIGKTPNRNLKRGEPLTLKDISDE